MPLYIRRCQDCGTEYERLEPMVECEAQDCPTCGHRKLIRIIAPTGPVTINGFSYRNGYSNGAGH